MTGGVDMLEAQALGHERTVRAFSDIAVLCRTHRQLELVEKCLRHDDIPCLVTGREDFLDDPAVRGALGFLRFPGGAGRQRGAGDRPPAAVELPGRSDPEGPDASAKRRARWTRRPCRRRSGATAFWKTGWAGQRSGSLWSGRKQPRKLVEQWEETVRHLSGPGTPAEHGGIPRGLRQPLGCSGPGPGGRPPAGIRQATGPPAQCA